MASTRSKTPSRRTARSATEDTPKQAVVAVARHGARIQIAAWTAAATTLTESVQTADRLTQAVGAELLRRVNGETDSAKLVAGVIAATDGYLRELTALPRAAANHFEARLAREPLDS